MHYSVGHYTGLMNSSWEITTCTFILAPNELTDGWWETGRAKEVSPGTYEPRPGSYSVADLFQNKTCHRHRLAQHIVLYVPGLAYL